MTGMPLTEQQGRIVEDFRQWIGSALADQVRFKSIRRDDREDDSTLAMRWMHQETVWFEIAVRPFLPQVRVGIVTTDRWKSEELEQMIEDSGDTMQEYVEAGFDAVDLEWSDPPVEHYRDRGRYFYFATPLDLQDLEQLADDRIRDRIRLMFEGYYRAFAGEPA